MRRSLSSEYHYIADAAKHCSCCWPANPLIIHHHNYHWCYRMAESPDGTVVCLATDPPFTDMLGHVYGLSAAGEVLVDGQLDRDAPLCQRIVYSGRQAWCQDRNGHWRHRHHHHDPWGPPGPFSPLPWDRFAAIEAQLAQVIDGQATQQSVEAAILKKLQNGGDNADVLDAITDEQAALQSVMQASLAAVQTTLATNQQGLLTAIADQSNELSPVLQAIQTLQDALAAEREAVLAAIAGLGEGSQAPVIAAIQALRDTLAEDYAAIIALLKEILALLMRGQPTKLALDFPGESIATQHRLNRPEKPHRSLLCQGQWCSHFQTPGSFRFRL